MDRETIKRSIEPVARELTASEHLTPRERALRMQEYRDEAARCWAGLMLRHPDAVVRLYSAEQSHWRAAIAARRLDAQRACRRHAEIAMVEFRMAQGLKDMGERLVRHINPHAPKDRGTLERRMHQTESDPIMALFLDGHLDHGHVKAARDIQWIYEAVTAGTRTRGGMDLGGGRAPQGSGRKSGDIGTLVAIEHAQVYKPWAERMAQAAPLAAILGVVAHDEAIYAGARKARMSWREFVAALREALEAFAQLSTPQRR